MKIQTVTVEEFLRSFNSEGVFNFACYGGRDPRQFRQVPFAEVKDELEALNQEGYDVYFIPNIGTGFTNADITKITAQFADYDCGRDAEGKYYPTEHVAEWKKQTLSKLKEQVQQGVILEPSIIVETRNGFAVYWLYVYTESVTPHAFQALQKAIAHQLNTDKSINNPARVMRLPFFQWRKINEGLDPFYCRVIKFTPEKRYTQAEISECFQAELDGIEDSRPFVAAGKVSSHDTGTYYLQYAGKKPIEVSAFMESGQLHAACPFCGDPKGHDIVLDPAHNRAYCNRCTQGAYVSQNKKDLYFHANTTLWEEIRRAEAFSDLSPKHIEAIQKYLAYNKDDRTPQDYFTSRSKSEPEPTPDPTDQFIYNDLYAKSLESREFPDIFPETVKTSLSFYRKKHGCRMDYIYNPFLFACSTAIGPKVKIQARGRTTDGKIWGMSIGTSGKGKSEPANDLFQLFDEKDRQEEAEYLTQVRQYEFDRLKYDSQIAKLKRSNDPQLFQYPQKPDEPVKRELSFNFCTTEAAHQTIKSNPHGILLRIDEFYPWYSAISKFNNATAAANLAELQMYYDNEFDQPVKIKRVDKNKTITMLKHYLTLYANAQPDILQETIFNPSLIHTGFIHRLLYYYPADTIYAKPDRKVYQIPEKHVTAIHDILNGLLSMGIEPDPWNDYMTIYLDDEHQIPEVVDAHYNYFCWLDAFEQNKSLPEILRAHVGRHKKHFSKLILILHLFHTCLNKSDIHTISLETVKQARKLSMYYISHFLQLYDRYIKVQGKVASPQEKNSLYDKILHYVRQAKTVTVRDVSRQCNLGTDKVRSLFEQFSKDGYGKCSVAEEGKNKGKIARFEYMQL